MEAAGTDVGAPVGTGFTNALTCVDVEVASNERDVDTVAAMSPSPENETVITRE